MISLLLCDQHNIDNVIGCIERIVAATDNLNAIEFIITTNHFDKTALFKEKLLHRYPVRIVIKTHGNYALNTNSREIFNFAYLQLHSNSKVVIPIFNHQFTTTPHWDKEINNCYQQNLQQLGHALFVMKFENNYFYTTKWLDISGGFGLIQDITAWTNALVDNAEKTLSYRLECIFSSAVLANNTPTYTFNALPDECLASFNQLNNSVAESISRYILDAKKKIAISTRLDKMDLIETCNDIAEQHDFLQTYSMLLHRHFVEASSNITLQHTFQLLDVFLIAILHKRQLLDQKIAPEEWLPFMKNWQIKELPEIKVE